MTANELATALFDYWNETEGTTISPTLLNDCADMLRQQQAEIEALKERNKFLEGLSTMTPPACDRRGLK